MSYMSSTMAQVIRRHPKLSLSGFMFYLTASIVIISWFFSINLQEYLIFKERDDAMVDISPCEYISSTILNTTHGYLFQGVFGGQYNGKMYTYIYNGFWKLQTSLNNNSYSNDLALQESNLRWFNQYMGSTYDQYGRKYRETFHYCKFDLNDITNHKVCVHADQTYKSVACTERKYADSKNRLIFLSVIMAIIIIGWCFTLCLCIALWNSKRFKIIDYDPNPQSDSDRSYQSYQSSSY